MLKLEDSIKGEKSFGVMIYEPPYTRPAWPVLSKVEGFGGVRGELRHLMAEPSTRLATGFIPFSLVFSVGKDILFCNFWWRGGWCELQMCMAFSVGFLTAILIFLNRWTRYSSVRAINTTISFFWFQNRFTILTLVKELTSVCWHIFYFFMSAVWTGNFWF